MVSPDCSGICHRLQTLGTLIPVGFKFVRRTRTQGIHENLGGGGTAVVARHFHGLTGQCIHPRRPEILAAGHGHGFGHGRDMAEITAAEIAHIRLHRVNGAVVIHRMICKQRFQEYRAVGGIFIHRETHRLPISIAQQGQQLLQAETRPG